MVGWVLDVSRFFVEFYTKELLKLQIRRTYLEKNRTMLLVDVSLALFLFMQKVGTCAGERAQSTSRIFKLNKFDSKHL